MSTLVHGGGPIAVDLDTALTTPLATIGRRANATSGEPVESKHVLYEDWLTEIGIWEVSPGTFPAAKVGVCELMQFIEGRGRIVDGSGVTEIGPGVVLFTPDGWAGTWEVEETVRKTYALHRTDFGPRSLVRALARRLRRSVRPRLGSP